MADTYKVLYHGQLAAVAAALYSPGLAKQAIIKNMMVTNLGANTEIVIFSINGVAAADQWGESLTLAPAGADGASMEWDGTLALANADSFNAKSTDAAAVSMTITGDEIS